MTRIDGRLLAGVTVLSAVVETGSFVKAAAALGMTSSGVSRAISRLETRLNVRLLDRSPRNLSLSEDGARFYDRIGPLLAELGTAAEDLSGGAQQPRGRLRVDLDPFFSGLVLADRLGQFLDRYPLIQLDLFTRHRIGDLVADGIDLAIRFGQPSLRSINARKLLDTRILTVASPDYIERHGRPTQPDDLREHETIHFRNPVSDRSFDWEFHDRHGSITVQTTSRLMVSDVNTMIRACVAGAGVAQVMEISVADRLAAGELVDLLPEWSFERFPLYALYPSSRQPPLKVRAFIDFALAAIGLESLAST